MLLKLPQTPARAPWPELIGHFYQNAYPVTAVVYGLYRIRDPDPANLAPLRVGDLNCVAERVAEHFEGTLRGRGFTPTRRQKIQEWDERARETGATVDDVAELEKRAIILKDIAGEEIFNYGKYQSQGGTTAKPGAETSTCPSLDRSTYMRGLCGTPPDRPNKTSQSQSGSCAGKTDSSRLTSSCSKTAAPTEHRRSTTT